MDCSRSFHPAVAFCLDRTTPAADLKGLLLGSPPFDDDSIAILDEVEAERKQDFGRGIDLMDQP